MTNSVASQLPLSNLPIFAAAARAQPTPPTRLFSTSSNRAQDRYEEYTDTPEGYTKPQSSRSQKPWYRSPTTLVLGFIPIFTFGLGYWQIKRLKWKVSLIEELEDKLSRDPLRLPRNINMDVLPEFDFHGNVGEAATRVSRGIPVGRAATIELRNQHAVYAATWFSLSACTAVMFGLLVRRGRG
ncbi:hypothetical protein NDA16_000433 [Ustilago loliicola]|nr:hypothetical protein NDA16_000433 [Ustilago loliicola]